MAKLRVKVIGSGTHEDSFRVNLPNYMTTAGTEKYSADGKTLLSVEVIIPDDECTDGKPDKAKIREKYKGQPLWDREEVLSDI